jgi:hypothetical protein
MLPAQVLVDIFQCLADFLIVLFFIIELRGAREDRESRKEDRKLQEKMVHVLEELSKTQNVKAQQEIEILEEVHAELADINDKQPDIVEEGSETPPT